MTFYNRITNPVYFNDFDEGACAWLAELMKQGHIPPGEIDRRSILEGTPPNGSFPLASGVRHRVELLRGYGNAINPQQAAVFIRAFFEPLEITSEGESTSDDGSTDGLIV